MAAPQNVTFTTAGNRHSLWLMGRINATSIITQPIDPKVSITKYFPIATQFIAVYKDIGTLNENLLRLHSRKNQLAIIDGFLSQALPVMDGNLDGLAAAAYLMRIEAGMRKDFQPSDWNRVSALNGNKHDLVSIQTRFTLELEQPTFFDTSRLGYLKSVILLIRPVEV